MESIAYAILSINDSRKDKKQAIVETIGDAMDRVNIVCVNGNDIPQTAAWMSIAPGIDPVWTCSRGEVGVWLSQMNAWRKIIKLDRPVLVFEDDAILSEDFVVRFREIVSETPATYDFVSVFWPNNQENDFYMERGFDGEGVPNPYGIGAPEGAPMYQIGSDVVVKTFQGYSCVATLISPKGAQKLLDLAWHYKMYTPVDCFFFLQANRGLLEGYSPHPKYPRIVSIDWKADTLIHDTPPYMV